MPTALESSFARRPGEATCPMCGNRYDPAEHLACQGCPLNSGCALTCCPACGYTSADPSQSVLLRALSWLRRA